jgi:hypothetical protein
MPEEGDMDVHDEESIEELLDAFSFSSLGDERGVLDADELSDEEQFIEHDVEHSLISLYRS